MSQYKRISWSYVSLIKRVIYMFLKYYIWNFILYHFFCCYIPSPSCFQWHQQYILYNKHSYQLNFFSISLTENIMKQHHAQSWIHVFVILLSFLIFSWSLLRYWKWKFNKKYRSQCVFQGNLICMLWFISI